MGRVYRARQTGLDRFIALKVTLHYEHQSAHFGSAPILLERLVLLGKAAR